MYKLIATLSLFATCAVAAEEKDPAAQFSRILIASAQKISDQCKGLYLEVESIEHPLAPDGQRATVLVPPLQRLTLEIAPLSLESKFKAHYHPEVMPWVGNPEGKWLLEEKTHRYDGATVLTVYSKVGSEHKMGLRHFATVDPPDSDLHHQVVRHAALDVVLLPFFKQPMVRNASLVDRLAMYLKQPQVGNFKVSQSSNPNGGDVKLHLVTDFLNGTEYHDEFAFEAPAAGIALKRHLSYRVQDGQRITEAEVMGSDFQPLVEGVRVPTKVKRIKYEQGKPVAEILYAIKAQIVSPTEQWLNLRIPFGYTVEDHVRGVTFQTGK